MKRKSEKIIPSVKKNRFTIKFPIDDARQRVVDCRALDEQRPFEKVEIFSRDTRPTFLAEHARFVVESNGSIIESAIRPSSSLECSDASLYIREAGGCQWSVYGASSDLNKRSVCKVRGLSIQASTECKKADISRQRGYRALTEWKSSWCPLFVCLLASSPLKTRLEIRDPIRANSFRLQTGRVTHVLFLTLKGHLSIVSSRIACFKLPGNVKQWAAVYETTVARFHCDCARDACDTGDSQAYYRRESIIFLLCLRKKIVSSLTNLLERMDIFSYLIIFYFSSFPSSIFGRKNILKNVLWCFRSIRDW